VDVGADEHSGAAPPPPRDIAAQIAALWRIEAARIVGALARVVRDVGQAEDLAQDALVEALERWPRDGLPERPAAWLMAVAKRRAIDALRARTRHAELDEDFARELATLGLDRSEDFAPALLDARERIADDQLRLIFTACHPLLAPDARAALALKVLAGLSTAEIARAFLAEDATIAQRIVRAKRTLAAAGVGFEQPAPAARAARLASVLEVVYLIFNEGHTASTGPALTRPALCDEALRLARQLAALMPGDAEAWGLLALLELSAARLPARHDAAGRPVLLLEQDRSRWDRLLIRRGLDALAHAKAPGFYALQARIAACHAQARRAEDTDWLRIVALYDGLAQLAPSPVVALNQAMAISRVDAPGYGPAVALELLDQLAGEPALRGYAWLHGARADLLERLGRPDAAREAYAAALALTRNEVERAQLEARIAYLASAACAESSAASANIFCISAKKRS